jgi:hypothetical protein
MNFLYPHSRATLSAASHRKSKNLPLIYETQWIYKVRYNLNEDATLPHAGFIPGYFPGRSRPFKEIPQTVIG